VIAVVLRPVLVRPHWRPPRIKNQEGVHRIQVIRRNQEVSGRTLRQPRPVRWRSMRHASGLSNPAELSARARVPARCSRFAFCICDARQEAAKAIVRAAVAVYFGPVSVFSKPGRKRFAVAKNFPTPRPRVIAARSCSYDQRISLSFRHGVRPSQESFLHAGCQVFRLAEPITSRDGDLPGERRPRTAGQSGHGSPTRADATGRHALDCAIALEFRSAASGQA
jgi:hypothetical protein